MLTTLRLFLKVYHAPNSAKVRSSVCGFLLLIFLVSKRSCKYRVSDLYRPALRLSQKGRGGWVSSTAWRMTQLWPQEFCGCQVHPERRAVTSVSEKIFPQHHKHSWQYFLQVFTTATDFYRRFVFSIQVFNQRKLCSSSFPAVSLFSNLSALWPTSLMYLSEIRTKRQVNLPIKVIHRFKTSSWRIYSPGSHRGTEQVEYTPDPLCGQV